MPLFEPVADSADGPEIRRVFDRIRARGGEPSPLYRTLARSPELLEGWAGFADALRHGTSLDRSIAELVVLRLAQLSRAPYQWAYHWKPALAAGLTEAQLRALERWHGATEFDERQRLALGLADAMYEGTVNHQTIAPVSAMLDDRQVLELVLTIGFYINVGRVLQALELEVEPSLRAFLP